LLISRSRTEEELLVLRSETLIRHFVGDDLTEFFKNERSRRSSGLTPKSISSSSSSDATVVASIDGDTGGSGDSAMLPNSSFDDFRLNFSRLLLADGEARIFTLDSSDIDEPLHSMWSSNDDKSSNILDTDEHRTLQPLCSYAEIFRHKQHTMKLLVQVTGAPLYARFTTASRVCIVRV
jgi:hypothetical protein